MVVLWNTINILLLVVCDIDIMYVLVIPQYKYNVLVITQVWGEAEDAGDN